MSIKDKMKNAKESHLFDELSEKEKFEAILEGKLKVRLISELEKIKAEINLEDFYCYCEDDYVYSGGLQKAIEIIDKYIAELKGK